MAWTELYPKSLDKVYAVLNQLADSQAFVFRGQPSASWKLTPSIHRALLQKPFSEKVRIEAAAIRAFRRHARSLLQPAELQYFDRILDGMTLMQHYGAPTRLLDWTLSPWVACYFASQDVGAAENDDPAIWAFNQDELYKSNATKSTEAIGRFRDLEKAATVEDWVLASTDAESHISTFRYQYANTQMGAQQSLFTLSAQLGEDHDKVLATSLKQRWQSLKIVIPRSCIGELRPRL